MNNRRTLIRAAVALIAVVVLVLILLKRCGPGPEPAPVPLTPVETITPPELAPEPSPVASPSPKKKAEPKPRPSPVATRPKVDVHPELIPKDITIVRVYYANMIAAPGATIEFDINGSGFTREFERMITVQSGRPDVAVKNLALVTPNQIHGQLVIESSAKTDYSFPTVSISGKVVFQAPDPFAVIRSGEVLNLVFTEMAESGRSGRFRVFTNLTPEMFDKFRVSASTPAIDVGNLTPFFPFVVDGTLTIGPALTGDYGLEVTLDGKRLWQRDGIIRVVRPNLGETGLVQRLQAEDGFHRPGDMARFIVQGSGFRFEDASTLSADVGTMDGESATFLYLAPGRLALDLKIPEAAKEGFHNVVIKSSESVLLDVPRAFTIVPVNWTRNLRAEPSLTPGTAAQLVLTGRALDKAFVENLKTEVDEDGLIIGPFVWVDAQRAVADIEAKAGLAPGDYQVRLQSNDKPVVPAAGNIIHVAQ